VAQTSSPPVMPMTLGF